MQCILFPFPGGRVKVSARFHFLRFPQLLITGLSLAVVFCGSALKAQNQAQSSTVSAIRPFDGPILA